MSPEERRPAGRPDEGHGGQAAGPVGEEGEALRAGSSSTSPSSPPPAAATSDARADGGQQVEQDLNVLLADAEAKKDEYLEIAKRAQADFENFRKRVTADVQAAALRGRAEIARDVVPVLDDLERALQAAGLDPEGDSEDGLAHGVILVFRGLRENLKRHGIEAVDPTGERFDPNLHEALSTQPVEGAEAGVVVEVMQKGYRMGEQLIRPARVVVSA
jgi:molecular chaperone GrpE